MKKKHNIVLYVLIVLGLVSALIINYQRHQVERVANSVEIMMDYEDLAKLASVSGKSTQQTLAEFKQAGVTTLNVYDTNLEKLSKSGIVSVITNSQLKDQRRLGGDKLPWAMTLTDAQLAETGVYVVGEPGVYWQELQEDAKQRFAASRMVVTTGSQQVMFIPGDTELVMVQHLGLPTEEMKYVVNNGFLLTVRPMNYNKVSAENIDSVFKRIDQAGVKATGIHFTALHSLGATEQMDKVAAELKKRDMTLAMAEHFLQLQFAPMLGIEKFPDKMDYRVARLYVIDKRERGKISVKDAVRRFAITDIERNIRINFLHNFEEAEPDKTLYETNIDYVKDVADSIQNRGFVLGRASTFAPYFPDKVLFIPIIFGVVAAGVLYLSLFFSREKFTNTRQSISVAVLAVILSVPILMGGGLSVRQLVAFGSAVLFPSLSMIYIVHLWDRPVAKEKACMTYITLSACWQITLAVVLSLIGGMYLAAILGDIRFFLELDIYRGVKATFITPILLVGFYYVFKHNIFAKSDKDFSLLKQLKALLNIKLDMRVLTVVGILGFIAWVFIGRSGHTAGVPVPAWEIKLRLFLEEVMYARPREKEFLIGHVAFFLAALASIKRYPRIITLAFVCAATIGQGSLVQTFAHMRTPVFMSTIRAIDGWALGIPIGIVVAIVFNYLYPYLRKIESELNTNE